MPDKRSVCSLADAIVFDFIPKKIGEVIDENITFSEDIKAVVKGMKGEALVVTDEGVYTVKKGNCHFFPYDKILPGKYIARVYRRGRFEIPTVDRGRVKLPDQLTDPDFGPDPAPNVINFPWSKVPLFRKAEEIITINKELHDVRKGKSKASKEDDASYHQELIHEIRKLNERLAKLEKEKG
ncbi:MAG: hypothetical protein D5R97_02920 [Candidatus Syntrophonatronum acetioxidans]|uniref:Uncharacterized protein n=1 Tax=Candidatus Syntrophonatronum acetioxidans TaxID=1795816 RepID=A0A424YGS6_9FIRM|nr:MAG: hypothetical protein D5R97_02920 [Candidatus Syntrophonatronum acetioxidans]